MTQPKPFQDNEGDDGKPTSSMTPPERLREPPAPKGPARPAEPEEPMLEIGSGLDATQLKLPLDVMKKHYVCFGASGSGKTVLGKVFLEECVRNGIPCIIVDPQGDLASLGIMGDQTDLVAHGADLDRAKEYEEKAEVRIFTPASSKGIPLRVEVFNMPDKDLPMEERVNALDMTASSIVQLLDYDYESPKGTSARKYLYMILEAIDRTGATLESLADLIEYVKDPEPLGVEPSGIIKKGDRDTLSIDMGHLTIGTDDLLFSNGVAMVMDTFLTPIQKGKVPVNIIYLNTLNTDRHKHFFLACLTKELYSWMLKHPSKDVQCAFYIDEVGPFMPPHPNNPPAKTMLKMLYKQGRKYGVSMMMCTQNIADIEYKALAQASTWALGRLMTQQDLGKVAHLLKSLPKEEYERILETIPKLKACSFVLINSDIFKKSIVFKCRWLYSQHATLDEEALKGAMAPEILDFYTDPLAKTPGDPVPFTPVEKGQEGTVVVDEPKPPEPGQAGTVGTPIEQPLVPDVPVKPGPITTLKPEDAPPPPTIKESPEDRYVYVVDIKVPQSGASKVLMDWSKELLYANEEVVKVDTEYLLLWRVRVNVEVQQGLIPMLAKKVQKEENLYVVASRGLPFSGQLMQVGDSVAFTNVTSKKAHEIKDLDGHAEFSVMDYRQLPFNLDVVPILTLPEVERIIYNLFGLQVERARRTVYKLWRFTIMDPATGKSRYVRVDSVFGKPVQMY